MKVAKFFCSVEGRGCAKASDEISSLSTPASVTASITTLARISCSSTCNSASRGRCHLATGSAAAPSMATLLVIGSPSISPSSAYNQRVDCHDPVLTPDDRLDLDLIDDVLQIVRELGQSADGIDPY